MILQRAQRRKSERGVAMVLAAVWLTAMVAITAMALEVSRLTDTATEVQVAADSAALAAATNLFNPGGTTATAISAGQAVAAKNQADGRFPAASDVTIEFGTYTSASGFAVDPAGKAVRATVTMSNVRYLLASVFGFGGSTTVTKRALALYECTGSAQPAPLEVCDCLLNSYTQGQPCSGGPVGPWTQSPDGTQNSCFLASHSTDAAWFPSTCGGRYTGSNPPIAVGAPVSPTNGQVASLLADWQDCLNQSPPVRDFTVVVIHCISTPACSVGNCGGTPPVIGFATIRVTQIQATGSPKTIQFEQICNNDAPGPGSPSATCFGQGHARLVADL